MGRLASDNMTTATVYSIAAVIWAPVAMWGLASKNLFKQYPLLVGFATIASFFFLATAIWLQI